jgi:hypothetical protein
MSCSPVNIARTMTRPVPMAMHPRLGDRRGIPYKDSGKGYDVVINCMSCDGASRAFRVVKA